MKQKLQKMHEEYGEDEEDTSWHLMCPNCGRCITCNDCECEMKEKWIKMGYIKE